MIQSEEIATQKSQADLMAQVIALRNSIIDLRRSGKIITQEQSELREYLQELSLAFLSVQMASKHIEHR